MKTPDIEVFVLYIDKDKVGNSTNTTGNDTSKRLLFSLNSINRTEAN